MASKPGGIELLNQGLTGKTQLVKRTVLGSTAGTAAKSFVKHNDTEKTETDNYIEEMFDDENNIVANGENENAYEENKIYTTTNYDMFAAYPKEELRLELHTGADRDLLKNSIMKHGITTPIKVVEAKDYKGNYEGNCPFIILGGHNRKQLAKETNKPIPFIVKKNLSEEECDEIVAEEHILNRQIGDFKPSQMITLLKAIKRCTENVEIFVDQVKKNSKMNLSTASIYRYLKLESLEKEFLISWVDTKRISLTSAQILAECNRNNQKKLLQFAYTWNVTGISQLQAEQLKEKKMEEWDDELLKIIFFPPKKITNSISIKLSDVKDIMPENDWENAKNVIRKALEKYYAQ